MTNPSENPFLHGVRKIDLDRAILAIARNKLVFTAKGSREHLTVHLGPHSGIFDVHRTTTSSDGSVSRVRLYAIPQTNVAGLCQDLAVPLWNILANGLQALSLDWMQRARVGAVVGLPPLQADVRTATTVRRGRLAVDPKLLLAQVWVPEYLDELFDVDQERLFTLFCCRNPRRPRKIGTGFGYKDRAGRRRLVWLSERHVVDAIRRFDKLLRPAAAKHGTFGLAESAVPGEAD
jgi:hypothetical protein